LENDKFNFSPTVASMSFIHEEIYMYRYEERYRNFVADLNDKPPVKCDYSVGDQVSFTNENGVTFNGLKVVGFAKDDSFYGRYIHLDTSSYWFPHSPGELKMEEPASQQEVATTSP
jgi:hypothetical protein